MYSSAIIHTLEEYDNLIKKAEKEADRYRDLKKNAQATLKTHLEDVIVSLYDSLSTLPPSITDSKLDDPTQEDSRLAECLLVLGQYVRNNYGVRKDQRYVQIYRGLLILYSNKLSQCKCCTQKRVHIDQQLLCDFDPLNERLSSDPHSAAFYQYVCPITGAEMDDEYFYTTSGFRVSRDAYMSYLAKYKKDPFTQTDVVEVDKDDCNPNYYFLYHLTDHLVETTGSLGLLLFIFEYSCFPGSIVISKLIGNTSLINILTQSASLSWIYPFQQTISFHTLSIAVAHLTLSCLAILAVCFIVSAGLCLYQQYQARKAAINYENSNQRTLNTQKMMAKNKDAEECLEKFIQERRPNQYNEDENKHDYPPSPTMMRSNCSMQ